MKYRSVALVLMISVIAIVYHMFNQGSRSASELRKNIRIVDMAPGRLALSFPDIPLYNDTVQFEYKALIMHQDTFLVRYAHGHPNALFFHSECSRFNERVDVTLNDEYVTTATNSLIGDGILIEHSIGATVNEVCLIQAGGHQIDLGSFNVQSVEIGHAKAPFLKLEFRDQTKITMELLPGQPKNLISLSWLNHRAL